MKWRHVPALSAALLVFKRSASHPQGIPVVAQRARIVPSATTSPACILCLGQIDLSIWIVINPHTTSATRFRTLCNVTRKLVRWRLGFHEQRPYYIGISSGCRQSPVRTLTYRRMRLHAGGALVVWPWMLFLNSRGYKSCCEKPAFRRAVLLHALRVKEFYFLLLLCTSVQFQTQRRGDWDKAVRVVTLASSTQWKMNSVIPFEFQVFPEYGDTSCCWAAPASRPVDVRQDLFWLGVIGRLHKGASE